MSMSRLSSLATFTGLSEAELHSRASSTPAGTATRVKLLSALDAALVQGSLESSATHDAWAALSATTREAHMLEDPLLAYARAETTAGFAISPALPAPPLDSAAKAGIARIASLATGFAETTDAPTTTTTATADASTDAGSLDSASLEFEQLKNDMNKLSQMQTAMSNVLNSMHTSAMSIINNLKA